MLHQSFNRNLHKLIKKVEWPMYVINVDRNRRCSCIDHKTNDGDTHCPNCLGTGYQISIYKTNAVKQPFKTSSRSGSSDGSSIGSIVSRYYMDCNKVPLKLGNIIIHDKEIDVIKFVRTWRTDSSKNQYYEAYGVLKKYNDDIILNNFYKIINK